MLTIWGRRLTKGCRGLILIRFRPRVVSRGEHSSALLGDEPACVFGACWFSTSLMKNLAEALLCWRLEDDGWSRAVEAWTWSDLNHERCHVASMAFDGGWISTCVWCLLILRVFDDFRACRWFPLLVWSQRGEETGYLAAWWFFTSLGDFWALERFLPSACVPLFVVLLSVVVIGILDSRAIDAWSWVVWWPRGLTRDECFGLRLVMNRLFGSLWALHTLEDFWTLGVIFLSLAEVLLLIWEGVFIVSASLSIWNALMTRN